MNRPHIPGSIPADIRRRRKAGLILCLALGIHLAPAHGQVHREFYRESLQKNNTGMIVLGTWAVSNMAIGGIGWSRHTGQRSYFHQMNFFWNTVNLSIAGVALYANFQSDFTTWDESRILEKQLSAQRLFLINAGLDILYMGGGVFMNHIAHRYPRREERLRGYGNAVILQGAFLFAFDMVMFGIQHSHRSGFLEQIAFVPFHRGFGACLQIPIQ